MRARRNVISIAAILSAIAANQAGAQVQVRPPTIAPGPRPPPAPIPYFTQVYQLPQRVWPALEFALPSNTVSIRVLRRTAGSTQPVLLTPSAVPVTGLTRVTWPNYMWEDAMLRAFGSYSYAVVAELDDGRTGMSAWIPFVSQASEAANVRVVKPDPYTAVIEFDDAPPTPPRTYRLFDTGRTALLSNGIEATKISTSNGWWSSWRIVVNNLAAGTYNWILRSEYTPNIPSKGIPVSVTMP
jgi:hypothetical protein